MKQQIKKIILVLCIVTGLVLIGYGAYLITSQMANNSIYNQLQQVAVVTPAPTAQPTSKPTPGATALPTQEPVEIPIDFEALKEINQDIYAWIEIPGTEVAYPIVQHPTNLDYYLDNTIEHAHGLPGSIYTQYIHAQDFSDFNTVIYGHNMKNDTMFGSLNNYRDATYLEEHPEIIIYTPTEKRVYQIFAAVVYDDRYIPYWYDNDDPDDCEAFLVSIWTNKNINTQIVEGIEVTADDEIITLSTCIGGMPNNRYLIEAVYVQE